MIPESEVFLDDVARGLRGRDLLSIRDLTEAEVRKILSVTAYLKRSKKAGSRQPVLAGKTLGMLFSRPSTRTRISFEVGMWELGGYPLFLSASDLQLGRGESVEDTARVLSLWLDGIMLRTGDHSELARLADAATIPVINGLSNLYHPCEALADYFTILEKKGRTRGVRLAFIGDGNNVANSLLEGAAKTGASFVIACPEGYEPPAGVVEPALLDGRETGATIEITHDPVEAARDADCLYTDAWASMGQEEERQKRLRDFEGFQINGGLVAVARPDVMVMHCLPARRGEEITADALDGPHSVVFEEAENRLHLQKAVLALLMR